MCTSHDSHPPIEPISGAAIDASRITLTGEDGARFRAYEARPASSTGAGILILPDVRGLAPFFEELALRFAERGIYALAIDYFGRTAGLGDQPEGFDYMAHVGKTRWETLAGDIRTGVAHLRGLEPAPRSVFTTGFCMGGRLSSMSATLGLGLAGAIPFYGWPVGPNQNGTPAPAENADKIECDLLVVYGDADEGIPEDARNEFERALDKAGVRHETVTYPGATHGFFDKRADQFDRESDDAWDRVLAFIRLHTMGQPIVSTSPERSMEDAADGTAKWAPDDPIDPRVEAFRRED
ncbi:MAG TPA: dienelactone hydrolase family protein [Candidatus Limnocylindria bacterium]|nr:dienelactone hydrolase family protein [Candidatus Limnocylindria bacterium]